MAILSREDWNEFDDYCRSTEEHIEKRWRKQNKKAESVVKEDMKIDMDRVKRDILEKYIHENCGYYDLNIPDVASFIMEHKTFISTLLVMSVAAVITFAAPELQKEDIQNNED